MGLGARLSVDAGIAVDSSSGGLATILVGLALALAGVAGPRAMGEEVTINGSSCAAPWAVEGPAGVRSSVKSSSLSPSVAASPSSEEAGTRVGVVERPRVDRRLGGVDGATAGAAAAALDVRAFFLAGEGAEDLRDWKERVGCKSSAGDVHEVT